MNTIKIIAILFLSMTGLALQAQNEMEAAEQKIEYILKEVELDGEQEAAFRETFQRHAQQKMEINRFANEESRQIKERFSDKKNIESVSIEEARAVLMRQMDHKQRQMQMESDYMRQLIENLGPIKVLQIQVAEDDFEEKLEAENEGR